MLDEACGQLPTGDPDGQVVAQAQHDVVPAVRDDVEREPGQVGVLVAQQGPDERDVDVDLGSGCGTASG